MEGRNKFCFDVAYGTIRVAYGTFIKLELREKMDFRMPPRKSDVSKTKTESCTSDLRSLTTLSQIKKRSAPLFQSF